MNTFFTADTHFFHRNIIELCSRPWPDMDAMFVGLAERWNDVVGPNDTVYHLGDFSFGPVERFEEALHELNGYKIIIRGNHDRSCKRLVELGFDEALNNLEVENEHGKFYLVHQPEDAPKHGKYRAVLHGHVHNSWRFARTPEQKLYINVGTDVWDYKPVTLDELLAVQPPYDEIRLIPDMAAAAEEHRSK